MSLTNRRKGVSALLITLLLSLLYATTGCATQMKSVSGVSRLGYSIQVGAFSDVHNAERLTNKLQARGIEAFYFRKDNGVYVVRFGDYPTRDRAKKGAEKLVSERLIDGFFVASPDAVFTRAVKPDSSQKTPQNQIVREKPRQNSDMGGIAARTAERFIGIPYRWGGDNVVDGMDCSGFVRAVYNLCGVNIPRTSGEQFKTGEKVELNYLKDGDLVFFGSSVDRINHVGIYVGNGRFVHAPRRGEEIRLSGIDERYFAERFVGARRYF